ncbi:PIN domain-containing protein [Rathayibacter soli]|uniref:hypothetical protein n=1 Tax=Rathayibacter soli TaxID=3144168 RepID=UPI0027E493EA|nr:hypothetical protein [Glaciibacter superstes]
MDYFTDEQMQTALQSTEPYTVVILSKTVKRASSGADAVIWEHGRRNFGLRAQGDLAVVCPISDESDFAGIYIFAGSPKEVREIVDGDPAVRAGILTYTIHATRTFPGDALPRH